MRMLEHKPTALATMMTAALGAAALLATAPPKTEATEGFTITRLDHTNTEQFIQRELDSDGAEYNYLEERELRGLLTEIQEVGTPIIFIDDGLLSNCANQKCLIASYLPAANMMLITDEVYGEGISLLRILRHEAWHLVQKKLCDFQLKVMPADTFEGDCVTTLIHPNQLTQDAITYTDEHYQHLSQQKKDFEYEAYSVMGTPGVTLDALNTINHQVMEAVLDRIIGIKKEEQGHD